MDRCVDHREKVPYCRLISFRNTDFLKKEVNSLRAKVEHPEGVQDARGEVLKQMDEVHMQKRKAKEERLMAEDPDFKATRKMRGAP